jgi:hypothetical protein
MTMKWHNHESYKYTLLEFAAALEKGETVKAYRIRVANPDLSVSFAKIERSIFHKGYADLHQVVNQ